MIDLWAAVNWHGFWVGAIRGLFVGAAIGLGIATLGVIGRVLFGLLFMIAHALFDNRKRDDDPPDF